MKTDFKDYILCSLSIILILSVTSILLSLISLLVGLVQFQSLTALINVLLFFLFYGFATVLYLRILNRFFPLIEGCYTMEHTQFSLWKHHAVVGELGKRALKIFFPFFLWPIFYIMFGAKIGKGVAIGGAIADPFLVKIGNSAVLGQDSVLTSHTLVNKRLFLKQVIIGARTTIGINSVIMPGVEVGENSVVAPGAVVLMDTKIPANEFWGGVPAKKIKNLEANDT
jgi:acetyltransferase-like isoleucine patch superfamily enzyme